MERVVTGDGSITFHNEEYKETYHSKSGAIEEAFKKFVEPCDIAKIAKKGDVKILDVCFGIGYNTLAALYTILKINPKCNIEIIALEKDKKILKKINHIDVPVYLKSYYNIIKLLINNNYNLNNENINIKIIIGDAAKTIKKIEKSFDAVFLDPFSPPKNPELWTLEFFKDVKERMNLTARLATYSCATNVRKSLDKAGFKVSEVAPVGRKTPSLVAVNVH